MSTLKDIRNDLQKHTSFFNILCAKVFDRRASLDEVMAWVEENPKAFEDFSGVKVETATVSKKVEINKEDADSLRRNLKAAFPNNSVSVCRKGKYRVELYVWEVSTKEVKDALERFGYTLSESLEGKFGSLCSELLHIATKAA